jgi:hypothetical protein
MMVEVLRKIGRLTKQDYELSKADGFLDRYRTWKIFNT